MDWALIAIALVSMFLIIEIVKHLFLRKISKTIIILTILIIIFLLISSKFTKEESNNKLLVTGASVLDGIKNLKDDIDFSSLKERILPKTTTEKNINQNTLSKIKNI